ncbi:MAG TPA: dTDP-4-dehydrorhamnose 3,5-epimerase [Caulobacteraceae bacterium]
MDVQRLEIPDVVLLRPKRHGDSRGFFVETWHRGRLAGAGIACDFVQDNLSYSAKAGTLRGLHYQRPPHAQAKLVSVLTGRALDVAVDARRGSPTYGRHVKAELSAETGAQLFVPEGFLHGFVTLEPDTRVAYKVSDHYAADCDGAVRWDDPDLAIDWGVSDAVLSDKDATAPLFADFDTPFAYAGAGA